MLIQLTYASRTSKTLVPEENEQDTTKFTALVLRGTYTKSLMNAKLNYQIGYDINREMGMGRKLKNKEITIGFLEISGLEQNHYQMKSFGQLLQFKEQCLIIHLIHHHQ